MSILRAVLFDLDNTLINFSQGEQEALKETLRHHGLIRDEKDWAVFWQWYETISWDYWLKRDDYTRHELTLFTFRDTLARFIGKGDLAEQISDMYWDRFCNSCHFEPGARELLVHLSGRYKLGIITNGYSESQRKRLAACGIDGLFQAMIISDEVGLRKPDVRMFEMALEQLEVRAEEALFVGDSLEDDWAGARNAGIPFCYYNRKNIPLGEHVRPDHVIGSLAQLKEIISQFK